MRHPILHFQLLILAVLGGIGGIHASSALANGRFPEAQRLLEHPGNPNRLYLTATYGLLVTEDRGQNWYTLCEQAFALKFLEGDPLLEVMADGNLLGGIFDTLNLSSDCGCTWQTVLGASATQTVTDIAVDKTTGAILALVQDTTTFPPRSSVHESMDLGRTWRKLSDLPPEVVSPTTLEVAPSDSSRVYVSALRTHDGTSSGTFLVSTDHAGTWVRRDFADPNMATGTFIAAVHPMDPDKVFLRTDEWDDSAYYAANDALLYSEDGGKSWREVIRRSAKLFGFALSSDAATILVGYGDPQQAGGRTTNSEDFGIYKADTAAFGFEKIFFAAISCLRWTANGFYACMVENHPEVQTPGMSLGFAPNPNFTLATAKPFTSLLSVKTVKGPLGCTAARCIDNWKVGLDAVAPLCDILQATCDITPSSTGLSCPVPSGAGGGGGPGAGGAAAGGRGGSPQGGGGSAAGSSGATGADGGGNGGCACFIADRAAGSRSSNWPALLTLLAFLPSRYRRRRARLPEASSNDQEGS